MSDSEFRELHIFAKERSRKLKRFEREASFASRKRDCLPEGVGGICFNVPDGLIEEAGRIAASLGLEWQPGGIGGAVFTCCDAVGDYLYAGRSDTNKLQIFDVQAPAAPVSLAQISLNGTPAALVVSVSICYVLCANGFLHVVSVDDPAAPFIVPDGVAQTGDTYTEMEISGTVAILSGPLASGVGLWDLGALPPREIETLDQYGAVSKAAAQGRRVFFGDQAGTPRAVLHNFRIGGFRCDWIAAHELEVANKISTELIRARSGHFKGELSASAITLNGGANESDTGEASVSHYLKLGNVYLLTGVGDPSGVFTVPGGGLGYFFSDGSAASGIWFTDDGGATWTGIA